MSGSGLAAIPLLLRKTLPFTTHVDNSLNAKGWQSVWILGQIMCCSCEQPCSHALLTGLCALH